MKPAEVSFRPNRTTPLARKGSTPRATVILVNRVMRWDPSSRAGAVAFRGAASRYDLRDMHEAVMDWASYQNLAGDLDNVEPSPVAGPYDWKAYLLEESKLAQKRNEKRATPKADAPEPASAPTVFYA